MRLFAMTFILMYNGSEKQVKGIEFNLADFEIHLINSIHCFENG
jgi:hypothetical protein